MRGEFYQIKCYSYKRVDLDKHYHEMNRLYYGICADVNLKPLFLFSIPEDLSVEVEKSFLRKNKRIIDTISGQIYQEIHLAL